MRFLVAFGVPEKSVFTRLFCVFASALLANFQDRLVMTASITLRIKATPHDSDCANAPSDFLSNNPKRRRRKGLSARRLGAI